MGIRFLCHHCNFELHVKDFQGGKRGKCPECKGAFRIPLQDAERSIAVDEPPALASSSVTWIEKKSIEATTLPASPSSSGETNLIRETVTAVLPSVLAASPNAMWLVRPPSGGQFGPAPGTLLFDWIQENRVTADSLLQQEGTVTWQEARSILPELFDSASQNGKAIPAPPKPGNSTAIGSDMEPAAASLASGIVAKRKAQKRRQQLTILIVLAVLSLLLLIALVVVLLNQSPPAQTS